MQEGKPARGGESKTLGSERKSLVTGNAGGTPGMVSLSELVESAVRHEDLPAPIDRNLRLGAIFGAAVVGAYLLTLLFLNGAIKDPASRPAIYIVGWSVARGAAFLNGGGALPVTLGLLVLLGFWCLYESTDDLTFGPRWSHHAALVPLLAGVLAAIPLLLIMVPLLFGLALWAALIIGGTILCLGIIATIFNEL
jgi:hypothetical protein